MNSLLIVWEAAEGADDANVLSCINELEKIRYELDRAIRIHAHDDGNDGDEPFVGQAPVLRIR